MTEPILPNPQALRKESSNSLKRAHRWCLGAFLVQGLPPWLLLGLAHLAYAEPSLFSARWEDICTSALLGTSAVCGLGMGGGGLYLLLRNRPWRRTTWLFGFLGWISLFAGIVYAQALLIFWVWW